jgi:hypothetical protein
VGKLVVVYGLSEKEFKHILDKSRHWSLLLDRFRNSNVFFPETAACFRITEIKPLKSCNLTSVSYVISSYKHLNFSRVIPDDDCKLIEM